VKKNVFIEGEGGFEVAEKTVSPKMDLKGKDVVFVAKKFTLSCDEPAKYGVKAEDGTIYMNVLSDSKEVGSEYAEAVAITALRGYIKDTSKDAIRGVIYVDSNLYYLFVVNKNKLLTMRKIDKGMLGEAIREVIASGNPVTSLVFLNQFDGKQSDLDTLESSLGISIITPNTGNYSLNDFIYAGILAKDLILPVIGTKVTRGGKVIFNEDPEFMPSILKGLAVISLCLIIGSLFHLMAVPYVKSLVNMTVPQGTQSSVAAYTQTLNDYAAFIDYEKNAKVSLTIDSIIDSLIKDGLEPISFDIAEKSVTAQVRTRDMDKALNFRKNFESQCTDITKEGPYFLFAFTVEVK